MKQTYNYNKENDILAIHQGFGNGEKFKGNLEAGKIILDISTKDNIRGIEIFNASDFFKEFNVHKKILEKLTKADFKVATKHGTVMIKILLKSNRVSREISNTIAIAQPNLALA